MDITTSQTLTQTGAGTLMGNLMRRYWVPVMNSSEIADADGPQKRAQLMGEKLLAFRDSTGQVGLINEFCTHRGVSLYYGRNEENGIRCSYHGLKFDRSGKCVDVPSAPNSPQICERMNTTGYPCIEMGGVVWAYMGPPDQKPAPMLAASLNFIAGRGGLRRRSNPRSSSWNKTVWMSCLKFRKGPNQRFARSTFWATKSFQKKPFDRQWPRSKPGPGGFLPRTIPMTPIVWRMTPRNCGSFT